MAKILFIHNIWYESLGIMQLSAVAKSNGHSAYLIMDGNKRKLFNCIERLNPDLIGFSIMTGEQFWVRKTTELIRSRFADRNFKIIVGGPHPTFAPEMIHDPYIDIICRGEAEGALLDLLNAIDSNDDYSRIMNLWVKHNSDVIKNEIRPLIEDLDTLPFPDRSIFYQYDYFRNSPYKTVLTLRGCPYDCSFCFNDKYRQIYHINDNRVRRRSCRNVIDEIKQLNDQYGNTKFIMFQDDIFILDKKWLKNFLKLYKAEIAKPFLCHLRSGLEDEEVIRDLADAGCIRAVFGVETGNEQLRAKILNKGITNTQIINTARLLKKYKIRFFVNNMFFVPGNSIADAWETVRLTQKIKPDFIVTNVLLPYPGTELKKRLSTTNKINDGHLNDIKGLYSYSNIKTDYENEEKNIYHLFFFLVMFPWITPLVKRLVKCKPNLIFLFLFKITAGLNYCMKYKVGFLRFIKEARHHYNYI